MAKYIKKPIAIDAEQFIVEESYTIEEMKQENTLGVYLDRNSSTGWSIDTLEGKHEVTPGDYIITGVKGEKYPCKKDIFEMTYIPAKKIGELSDGFHTFNELYDHRITIFVALCNLMEYAIKELNNPDLKGKHVCWKSKLHDDGTMFERWFIAGIGILPGRMITYHLPINRWDELKVKKLKKAPKWDGHTPADVIERIKKYLY